MLKRYKNSLSDKGEIYLRIKANPGASFTKINEIMDDDTIKIDISAPREKNRANLELIKHLAGEFDIDKKNVKIISGIKDRLKLIKIKK